MIGTLTNRWTTALALGVISLASLAPMAQAGHAPGDGNKWRRFAPNSWHGAPAGDSHGSRGVWSGGGFHGNDFHGRRVVVHGHSVVGPAIAGLVGGLVLGTALSHAAPVHERVVYQQRVYDQGGSYPDRDYGTDVYYVDPSCGERFDSFEACSDFLRYENHPQVIDVVDARSGRCLDRFANDDGLWREIGFDEE